MIFLISFLQFPPQVTLNDMNELLSKTIPRCLPVNSVEEVECLLKEACEEIQKDSTIIRICSDYGADESTWDDVRRQMDTATLLQFEHFKKLNLELLEEVNRELEKCVEASLGRISSSVERVLENLRVRSSSSPVLLSEGAEQCVFL